MNSRLYYYLKKYIKRSITPYISIVCRRLKRKGEIATKWNKLLTIYISTGMFKNKAASMVSRHGIRIMHVVSVPYYDFEGNPTKFLGHPYFKLVLLLINSKCEREVMGKKQSLLHLKSSTVCTREIVGG